MFEETQTSETMDTSNEDIDLFADNDSDFIEEPTSELMEQTQQEVELQGGAEQNQQTDPEAQTTLDIVYNGQPMQLSREQAVQLAQKGMNYDKKLQEIELLKNSPERQLLSQLAEQSGLPYDQFLNNFQNQIRQSTVQVKAEQLAMQNGLDMDTAMMLAESEFEKEQLQNRINAEDQKRQQFQQQLELRQMAEAQWKNQFTREISEILKENPDFQKQYPNVESMPKVMQDAILGGGSIKQAYQQYVIEQQRNEIAAYKQNQINMNQSPGSAVGRNANSSDAFLSSLFGDD